MSATMTAVYAAPAAISGEEKDPCLFRRARTWWTLAAICIMADGNGFSSKQDDTYYHKSMVDRYASSSALLFVTIAMWVIIAALMAGHIRPTLRTMLKQKPLLAVAIYALVSTLWSPVPLLTFKRAILLALTFAFAWFFATYYSPEDQRRILLAAGTIMAIASIAWVILLPSYGIASAGEVAGEWKGVFGQKNELGIAMAAFFSVLPFCRIPNPRRLLTVTLQAIVPLFLIVRSHARESLIVAVLFAGVRVFGHLITKSRREQLPFILYTTATGVIGIVLGFGEILSLLVKGAVDSWAGRLHEWGAVVPYISKHFWFGYGLGGFWTGEGDCLTVMKILHASLMGSDSGYTDNMLSFGAVGMSILLIVLLVAVRDSFRLLRSPSIPLMAFWYVGFILLTWVEAIVGNTFPAAGAATTFIFVVASCGLTNLRETLHPSSIRYKAGG
jgi:exopolysaccharide production protein ExoQ